MSTIQQALDQAVANGGGPGIVADLRRGSETWFGTAGVADLATGAPRRPGEHFRIGSFTKAFVGTLVLQVVAEGKLTLDDTVAAWLPGLVEEHLGGDGTRITLRHLLNHTSGLPDGIPGQETPPLEEPGKRFIYAKTNYTLAGMIVESATGAPLADELDRRLASPLGLTGTYLPAVDDITVRAPHARHYSKFDGFGAPAPLNEVTEVDQSWAGAAGGMISTTTDLLSFLRALLAGELLPAGLQEEMFTTVPTDGADWVPDTRYGLGVYSQDLPCGVTLWGGGGYIQGSMTYAMGDREGSELLVCNLNGDWNDFFQTFTGIYGATFCSKRSGTTR